MIDRLNAALEGRYRIERELGQGGMATVYLAEDLKHRRNVAVKVLRPELAAVVGAERFLAEIETTANLQHPYILPLFDSGEADGFLFYVMPYVEGESLREKLDREKQLRVDEAVEIARKVADALDYAHEQGVVHRDVKPANILLSARGEPLVADFGIARAVSQAGGGRLTETGLSLGTPHYMSPEQATGDQDVDPRSDVYALGCVLYELLAGEPPFAARTAQAVLVRILTEEPRPVTDVRRSVPPHVAAVIGRSLEKLPADRFPSAEAFAGALRDPSFRYVAAAPADLRGGVGRRGGRQTTTSLLTRALAVGGGVLVLALLVAGLALFGPERGREAATALPPTSLPPTSRFSVAMGEHPVIQSQLDLSPDGRMLVYSTGGDRPLYLRAMDALEPVAVRGTEGARWPVFSPDGEWIAFMAADGIRRIAVTGGSPLQITSQRGVRVGLHWGDDGTLVYPQQDGIYRVSAQGGEPERVLKGVPIKLRFPRLLPGGQAILFSEVEGTGAEASAQIRLLDLASGEVTTLVREGTDARYVETGHLVYGHPQGALFAVPFDLERLEVIGAPFPVLDEIRVQSGFLATAFAASRVGTVAYVGGRDPGVNQRFVLVDHQGRREPLPLRDPALWAPRFSPDGRKLVYQSAAQIYVYDLVLGSNTRLTFEGMNYMPVWIPGADAIVFQSAREGTAGRDLFRVPASGGRQAELLWSEEGDLVAESWTPDGSRLLYTSIGADGNHDLKLLDLRGEPRASPFLAAEWDEVRGRISPDSRWVAYGSDESGAREIYVRTFPEPEGKWKVSEGGGWSSRWSPDGRELYYRRGDTLVAARVRTEPSFQVLSRSDVLVGNYGIEYDVRPDGSGFVFWEVRSEAGGEGGEEEESRDLIVVVNWFDELLRRAGGRRATP
jgi:eukaryotic-like serine/threonine-protein kinase